MKIKNILLGLLAATTLALASCQDGLDIPKHGNMGGQEDYYKTDDEAEAASAAMYASWSGSLYNWILSKNLLSDDVWCGGGSRGDNSDMERLNEYTFDTDHGMIESLYSGYYGIIYNANLIIEKVTPDTPCKARCVAEAYFFRGWAHFELASLFGTAPVVDHLLNPDEYRKGNSTQEELYTQAEKDFKAAIDSKALPSKSGVDDDATTIRVTNELAKAMLGKAYLFDNKAAEAATALDEVINSGKYALYRGDLDQLLHAACNNNCEWLLQGQKRNDQEQAWTQFTMTYIMLGWRTELLNLGDLSGTIGSGTYGFLNPQKGLYDAFVAAEGDNGYRLRATLRTYDSLNKEYGVALNSGNRLVGCEGILGWKYRLLKEDCITDQSFFQVLQYTNLPVMRYAEVLLLAAEAHAKGGNAGKAAQYVNEVRDRAKLAPLASVTLDDIKKEKRLELAMEAVRFQDLVRWGDAETALKDQGSKVPAFSVTAAGGVIDPAAFTNSNYGFQAKHKLLPIPRKEITLNANMQQNEGWK